MNAVVEKPRTMTLTPARRALAEQWRQDWVVNAEDGTTVEDLKDPAYWAHVASDMQQYDRVEVREETGQWIVDLIITGVGRNWASVLIVAKHDLTGGTAAVAPESPKYKVMWRGPQHKWCVKRLSDNEVLQAGMESEIAGTAWLEQYERTVNG